MSTIAQYKQAVDDFNFFNGFEIITPSKKSTYNDLIHYTPEVIEHTKMLQRYYALRKQGFSDDHLATEIGLFVLHHNKNINFLDNQS